jgi:predicted glutamine amidotransferase
MCRILGCVASEPVFLRHELLEAENPLIHQAQEHDSGWGMAVYRRGEGEEPHCVRFPNAAYADGEFHGAVDLRGRIFNAHVRRATMGGLTEENTHPFSLGSFSFSHNGTILEYPRLLEPGVNPAAGHTDSEHFFNYLMRHLDEARVIDSLRVAVTTVIDRSSFSGMNFLFSDGELLYAYKLGIFELHWLSRPGVLYVASERITEGERWHSVQEDVLLVLDPRDPEEPHAERLVGDDAVARADIRTFEEGAELRGTERGEFAAQRAARMVAGTPE